MIQDLGATFGPSKMNLARWRSAPIWADRATCAVSMRHLPRSGATFPDAQISEAGRALLAGALSRLREEDVRALFMEAGVHAYQASTDDERDLRAWTDVFQQRVNQIVSAGPCPHRPSGPSD
jgi:hypothetical protein